MNGVLSQERSAHTLPFYFYACCFVQDQEGSKDKVATKKVSKNTVEV